MKTLYPRDIKKIVPHRGRALLLDKVEVREKGDPEGPDATAWLKIVKGRYLKGHFPGYPLYRGVDTVEFVAQTLIVAALYLEPEQGKTLVVFGGLNGVRFRGEIKPGDVIKAGVRITQRSSRGLRGSGVVFNGEKVVTTVEEIFGVVGKKD